ncbi:MAG: hypothetical protein ACTTKH_04190 [Treponema sp.]
MVFTLGASKEVLQTRNQTFKFFGNAFLPSKAFIPIGYDEDTHILVNKYSKVREGELIARNNADSPFSYVHSSIPGVVTDFKTFEVLPNKILKAIEVSLEGSFDILGKPIQNNSWKELTPIELFDKIEQKGVVNTSNRIIHSLASDIKNIMEKQNVELATSLFDFYPSQSLDIFLNEEYIAKVVEATLIVAKIIGSEKIVFFHNEKNTAHLKKYMEIAFSMSENIEFKKVKNIYPLHLQLGNRFFLNASTLLYVYEAIINDYPLVSVYLSIQGNIISTPKILHVKVGTSIGNVIEECGGIKAIPEALIINGLTHGYAITNLDIPITKDMKSIHVVSKERLNFYEEMECINCGKCFNVCPCFLDPIFLERAIKKNAVSSDVAASIQKCEGCACCSIVCPSRKNLCKTIISYKDTFLKQ